MSRRRAILSSFGLAAFAVAASCTYDFEAFDPRIGGDTSAGTGTSETCTPGETAPCYSGREGTQDVGICQGGTLTCNDEGTGFGSCQGEITPLTEDCNTSEDDDCDGEVNEPDAACECVPGNVLACYEGPQDTQDVGNCYAGQQICQVSGTAYGVCYGQSLPRHESCETAADDDCDDTANDHCATWSRRYGDTGYQIASDVVVDGSDNVIFAGLLEYDESFGGGTVDGDPEGDALVVKLDSAGDHVWSFAWGDNGTTQEAFGVDVDSAGNVYVVGSFAGGLTFGALPALTSLGSDDVFVAKLDPDGVPLWAAAFGDVASDHGRSIAVDDAGGVVITGRFWGDITFGTTTMTTGVDPDPDGFIVKLDATTGAVQWAHEFGAVGWDAGYTVRADSAGAFYVVGLFDTEVDFGGGPIQDVGAEDAFVVKFDVANLHQWSLGIGDGGDQHAEAMALDNAENLWIGGDFDGTVTLGSDSYPSVGADDMWVAKLDRSDGSVMWSGTFGGDGDENLNALAADGAGNVLMGGSFDTRMDLGDGEMLPAGEDDWFIAELNNSGALQYSRRFGGTSDQDVFALDADSANAWIVAGHCEYGFNMGNGDLVSGSSSDICLGKVSP